MIIGKPIPKIPSVVGTVTGDGGIIPPSGAASVNANTGLGISPSILVRSLGTNYDPLYGQGQANYVADIYAVAQILLQKLQFLMGEWWENLNLGFPLFQSILGQFTPVLQISTLIQSQILSTPYVTGIQNAECTINPNTREVTSSYTVLTSFGPISLTGVNQTFTAVIN